MPMHLSALPPLTNTDSPANLGERGAGKGTNRAGRGCSCSLISELEGFWTDTRQQHVSGPCQPLLYATRSSTFSFQTEGMKIKTETSSAVPKQAIRTLCPSCCRSSSDSSWRRAASWPWPRGLVCPSHRALPVRYWSGHSLSSSALFMDFVMMATFFKMKNYCRKLVSKPV